MVGKSLTGIIPVIVIILLIVGAGVLMNSSTKKSSSNYNALKDYMSPDEIKSTLAIITNCGITNYDIERDDSLDELDGENTLGFRLKSSNYNAIMYIKDKKVYSIRFADNDLYRNDTLIKKITEVK